MSKNAYFKEKLLNRRVELVAMLEVIEDRLDDPKSASFSEQAIESEDDEVLEARGKSEYGEIKAIDAALLRIENDSFGICHVCENEISDERLEAVPFAVSCRNCMHD